MLIPSSNVQHLMLRHDVVDAVRQGRFHVLPVTTVDEAMEVLTGMPAGRADESGFYPTGTVNQLVADRLASFTEARMSFLHGGAESS